MPENIMTALTKCEATLPMDSQQAVKDACANEAENAPKWAQVIVKYASIRFPFVSKFILISFYSSFALGMGL